MKRLKKLNLTEDLARWLETYSRHTGLAESDHARRALEQYREKVTEVETEKEGKDGSNIG